MTCRCRAWAPLMTRFDAAEALALKNATGERLGNNVASWRAYVRGDPLPEIEQPSIAQRLWSFF